MKFTRLTIPELILIEPLVIGDGRGFFYEAYHRELFRENGIDADFVQDNRSCSAKGVLRGLHCQIKPRGQAKLVSVTRGEALDVALDIRKGSGTFGRHVSVLLTAENKRMLYIPEGFAHGFCAQTDGTEFFYKVTDFYSPEHERGIFWNDPDLNIAWPRLDTEFIVSARDEKMPLLKTLDTGSWF